MSWAQVPETVTPPTRIPLFVPGLLAVVPLWGQFRTLDYPSDRLLSVVVITAVWLVAVRVVPRLAMLVGATAVGALALLPAFGTGLAAHVAPLLFVPLVLWSLALPAIVLAPVRLPGGWPLPTGHRLRIALLPLGPAAVSLFRFTAFRFAMLCMVAACGLALVAFVAPRQVDRLVSVGDGLMDRLDGLGVHLGRLLSTLVMLPAVAVVTVVWLIQRVVRIDPLRSWPRPGTFWIRRRGEDPHPARLFSAARVTGEAPPRATAQRLLGSTLTLALVAGLVVASTVGVDESVDAVSERFGGTEPCFPPPAENPVYGDDPAWPGIVCEVMDFADHGRFDAVTTYIMQDHASEHVNVTDGVRATWRAPACSCRRVTMWMFGGSAAFGWWQRDDHTVASELAKAAWKDGIALDIELRAMPGWVLGQGVRKFGELSTLKGEEAPDFALFYDGGNDLNRQVVRDKSGRGADESETSFSEEDIDKLLRQGPFTWTGRSVEDGQFKPGVDHFAPATLAGHAMNRYLSGVELARRLTAAAGTELVVVWQPLQAAAPLAATPVETRDPVLRAEWRTMIEVAQARLPDDVIDLSATFDDVDEPMFNDTWHTNELGSKMAAADIYRRIDERLAAAAG